MCLKIPGANATKISTSSLYNVRDEDDADATIAAIATALRDPELERDNTRCLEEEFYKLLGCSPGCKGKPRQIVKSILTCVFTGVSPRKLSVKV